MVRTITVPISWYIDPTNVRPQFWYAQDYQLEGPICMVVLDKLKDRLMPKNLGRVDTAMVPMHKVDNWPAMVVFYFNIMAAEVSLGPRNSFGVISRDLETMGLIISNGDLLANPDLEELDANFRRDLHIPESYNILAHSRERPSRYKRAWVI